MAMSLAAEADGMTAGTGLAGSWAGLDMTERADGGASCGARAALLAVRALLALIWRTRLPYTRSRPDRAHSTLRTRSAHALHTRCAHAPARSLGAPPGAASRATHATHARSRGHQPATNQMYTRHCASASSTAALSLSRSLRLHCTRAAVWRREAAADAQRACPSASLPNGRRQGGRRRPAPAISTAAAAIATMAFRAVGTLHRDGGGQAGQVV